MSVLFYLQISLYIGCIGEYSCITTFSLCIKPWIASLFLSMSRTDSTMKMFYEDKHFRVTGETFEKIYKSPRCRTSTA